jgi:hypothetical protein
MWKTHLYAFNIVLIIVIGVITDFMLIRKPPFGFLIKVKFVGPLGK